MNSNFYLKTLVIQNFATFRNQTIKFRPGFNVIVGETGSGKSLVLDALELVLGGRADKKAVRKDTDFFLVEAVFHCEDASIRNFLDSEGYPQNGNEILIKRLIYKNGTSKTYMNHLSCTVSFLSSFSKKYVDLVGQFENQRLLSEGYQLQLLDQFAKLHPKVKHFQDRLKAYRSLCKEKIRLETNKQEREQRLDYLNYQLNEIENLNPTLNDEEVLLRKKHFLMNYEKDQKVSFSIYELIKGHEGHEGITDQIHLLISILTKNKDSLEEFLDPACEILDRLETLSSEIENKFSAEIDTGELEAVLDRLDSYQKLKKKFGGTVESVLQTNFSFLQERKQLMDLESGQNNIRAQILQLENEVSELANELHSIRTLFAPKLANELTKRVQELRMIGATVSIVLERNEDYNDFGNTRVNFNAQTNPGEGFFKVKDIASGGELSRILLAIRQILSSYDSISIFLFDEIDTGIGGDTANFIGRGLKEVSLNGQVIAITHLPQIAQFADELVVVNKDSKAERTESFVRQLSGSIIKKEVKAMAQLAQ